MKRSHMILGAAVLAAVGTLPVKTYAADPRFCRYYTDLALRQSHQAREMRCLREFEYNPDRWSEDGRGHFDWCLRVPREYAEQERDIRNDSIRECRESYGDRDRDHDRDRYRDHD